MEWRLEVFENRPSLWKLIEELVPESERLEIKEALGEDLVDETLDLQNEVSKKMSFIFKVESLHRANYVKKFVQENQLFFKYNTLPHIVSRK